MDEKLPRSYESMTIPEVVCKLTENAQSVLELGAGDGEYLRAVHSSVWRRWGIECYSPYIEKGWEKNLLARVNLIHGDMRCYRSLLEQHNMPEAFDVALLIDSLEHISWLDGVQLLTSLQNHVKRIVVFTPWGFHPQDTDIYNLGGDKFQKHLSGWYPSHLQMLGFQQVQVDPEHHKEKGGAILAVWDDPRRKR